MLPLRYALRWQVASAILLLLVLGKLGVWATTAGAALIAAGRR